MFQIGLAAATVAVMTACATPPAESQEASKADALWIADSVSPEAKTAMTALLSLVGTTQPSSDYPKTPAEWAANREQVEQFTLAFTQPLVETLSPYVSELELGGVPALKVVPKGGATKSGILIYVHGGGFTNLSARSTLSGAALMAAKTGRVIYSLDYTRAPDAKWDEITDQVLSAYAALLAEGNSADQIGIFGDSAGGTIVAASMLKLRDKGRPMPAAILLQSPVTDLKLAGDTIRTVAAFDPALDVGYARARFAQYASPSEFTNPYVSPVYGIYNAEFPPVLIQAGTREIVLSDSVRLYQQISKGGGDVVLDVYEGMPHVFQSLLPGTPESDTAYARSEAFWDEYIE
jgi:acetyl esterase/lipase